MVYTIVHTSQGVKGIIYEKGANCSKLYQVIPEAPSPFYPDCISDTVFGISDKQTPIVTRMKLRRSNSAQLFFWHALRHCGFFMSAVTRCIILLMHLNLMEVFLQIVT
jgi:hypothetical protein